MKRAQTSIEFIILIGGVLFFFVIMMMVFQQNIASKTTERKNLAVQEVALGIQKEISLAASSSDGYQRNFNIPQTILGMEYNVTLDTLSIYIYTLNGDYASSLRIEKVTGQIQKGNNFIRKVDGEILLN